MRLSGQLQRPDGTVAPGPRTTWKGLNKPHRADRRWATAWSPEQVSQRLVVDFPNDEDMRISHEAIYQALHRRTRRPQARAGGLPGDRTRSTKAPGTLAEQAAGARHR